MNYSGKIITLAYPDTFVKMSDELMCKLLPLLGLGTKTHIKAGHAAMVLIENATGKARYFDFGRYITPEGRGRVRGENTDVELEIPFKAKTIDGKLQNLNEFLLWLDAHPDKTHGSGRLVASVCECIHFEKALAYINDLQGQGSIPYKAFGSIGSNCARFVTETILSSTDDPYIIKSLNHNKKFTPSTVGTVEKCSTKEIYEILNGEIKGYSSSAFRENLTNYFDKRVPEAMRQKKSSEVSIPNGAQLLEGTGSSAWFCLMDAGDGTVVISRYTENGDKDFKGIALVPDGFNPKEKYSFVYDCNCLFCTIEQAGKIFRFELSKKEVDATVSLAQMVCSA